MSRNSGGRGAGGRRVWIVNHYAGAPDRPSGSRHFELARGLVSRGHEVTIFAAGFGHSTGKEERLRRGQLFRSEWFDGVQFVWLRTTPYRGNTIWRQANMLSFLVAFLVVQTRHPSPDTVIGSTVHPFAALGGWMVARLRRARFVFEIRDLWPQTLVDLGAMRVGSPGERLLRALEAFLVRRAVSVITLLPGMRDYLTEQGLPLDHVVYIPNGVNLTAFEIGEPREALPDPVVGALAEVDRLRADGRVVFGYIGAFGRVNRVDVIVRAAEIAEERAPRTIGVLLVGDGPERPPIEAGLTGCRAIALCAAIPKRHVPVLLRAVDATVVHATATPVYRYGISFNKLFEYMAAERPVAFACASAYDPVAATGAGESVAPDDPDVLADAFLRIVAEGVAGRAAMGAAGREYVTREHNMVSLVDTLSTVVTG